VVRAMISSSASLIGGAIGYQTQNFEFTFAERLCEIKHVGLFLIIKLLTMGQAAFLTFLG
jgi:hypothetical protein